MLDSSLPYHSPSFSSGKPATDVKRDRMPASAAAETTATQLTSPITTEVPIMATAVCATVLTALIPAALAQVLKLFFILIRSSFRCNSYPLVVYV